MTRPGLHVYECERMRKLIRVSNINGDYVRTYVCTRHVYYELSER